MNLVLISAARCLNEINPSCRAPLCQKLQYASLWLSLREKHFKTQGYESFASTDFTICTVYKASCASILDLLVNKEVGCNRCHADRTGNQNHRLQWPNFRYLDYYHYKNFYLSRRSCSAGGVMHNDCYFFDKLTL